MIPLTRSRQSTDIHTHFHGAGRKALNLKLLNQKRAGELNAAGEKPWDSNIWKQAKDRLLIESGDKCAYCETPTKVVDYGDVEHFRPKSKYWWLAYCYDNYLVSCAICNQRYKKDEFPVRNEQHRMQGPSVPATISDAQLKGLVDRLTIDPVKEADGKPYQEFYDDMAAEWALLVNPYFEDPSEYFAYTPILETREVHVVPTKPGYADVVDAAEKFFGINRQELLDLRFQWYCLYMTYRLTLADPGISTGTRTRNQNRITDMKSGKMAYTGMVRYLEAQRIEDLPWSDDIGVSLGLL